MLNTRFAPKPAALEAPAPALTPAVPCARAAPAAKNKIPATTNATRPNFPETITVHSPKKKSQQAAEYTPLFPPSPTITVKAITIKVGLSSRAQRFATPKQNYREGGRDLLFTLTDPAQSRRKPHQRVPLRLSSRHGFSPAEKTERGAKVDPEGRGFSPAKKSQKKEAL